MIIARVIEILANRSLSRGDRQATTAARNAIALKIIKSGMTAGN